MASIDASSVRPVRPRRDPFAVAARHSRHVRILRLVLPMLAVLSVAGFVVRTFVAPYLHQLPDVTLERVNITGAAVTMDNPKLAGFSKERRAYEITARTAQQGLADPLKIRLDALTARLELDGEGWARLEAADGVLDSQAQVLELDHGVRLNTDAGDAATLGGADIELKAGRIVSEGPVQVQMGQTRLEAERMEVTGNGSLVVFEGRVVMTMQPGPAPASGEPR